MVQADLDREKEQKRIAYGQLMPEIPDQEVALQIGHRMAHEWREFAQHKDTPVSLDDGVIQAD